MYSYDERIKAVKLYIQYDKSYASLFRELGYPPSSHTIKLWYKEYKQHGDLHKSFKKSGKYSAEQRKAAIQYYIDQLPDECVEAVISIMTNMLPQDKKKEALGIGDTRKMEAYYEMQNFKSDLHMVTNVEGL